VGDGVYEIHLVEARVIESGSVVQSVMAIESVSVVRSAMAIESVSVMRSVMAIESVSVMQLTTAIQSVSMVQAAMAIESASAGALEPAGFASVMKSMGVVEFVWVLLAFVRWVELELKSLADRVEGERLENFQPKSTYPQRTKAGPLQLLGEEAALL